MQPNTERGNAHRDDMGRVAAKHNVTATIPPKRRKDNRKDNHKHQTNPRGLCNSFRPSDPLVPSPQPARLTFFRVHRPTTRPRLHFSRFPECSRRRLWSVKRVRMGTRRSSFCMSNFWTSSSHVRFMRSIFATTESSGLETSVLLLHCFFNSPSSRP